MGRRTPPATIARPLRRSKRADDLKVPGQVVRRIERWAESDRLRGIRVTFTEGTQRLAGKAKGAL